MLALPHTDWLYHHLRVTGEPVEVAAFRAVAAGAGVMPWAHDLGTAAADEFHLLAVPSALLRACPELLDLPARDRVYRPNLPLLWRVPDALRGSVFCCLALLAFRALHRSAPKRTAPIPTK